MSFLSVRSSGLLAATFLVALLAAPPGHSEALAGCGDYVHLGQVDADLRMDAAHSDPSAGWPLRAHSRQSTPAPCHGPACHQGPPRPTAPTPIPSSTSTDQKAWLDAHVETWPTKPGRIFPDAVMSPDDDRNGRMERPPRRRS